MRTRNSETNEDMSGETLATVLFLAGWIGIVISGFGGVVIIAENDTTEAFVTGCIVLLGVGLLLLGVSTNITAINTNTLEIRKLRSAQEY